MTVVVVLSVTTGAVVAALRRTTVRFLAGAFDAVRTGVFTVSVVTVVVAGAPEQKLTVVRLGKTDQDQRPALENALADVIARYR